MHLKLLVKLKSIQCHDLHRSMHSLSIVTLHLSPRMRLPQGILKSAFLKNLMAQAHLKMRNNDLNR
ncbi:CLUMA_CG009151, isoform A [Clunio marinus]|uniref:CLUMA_CG009151, isoform A n=1 Tax=Clunio marinus TaxID=568069 RepID=A0A1J1I5X2_9DIPT|nr:CLUMA_CG009151, isoform A [Clunio marinus]